MIIQKFADYFCQIVNKLKCAVDVYMRDVSAFFVNNSYKRILHILHIFFYKYRRLDSDPDAVWEMIH